MLQTGCWIFLCILPALATAATKRYVWQGSPNPAAPYTNWATAARKIQVAVDAAQPGDIVLVTNGVYAKGGRPVHGLMTNRLVIDKPITVRSVNGPSVTAIVGAPGAGGGNGEGAIRCAYVGTNAVLKGFSLTNGHTRSAGEPSQEQCGGGVWCEPTGVVTNCVLAHNSARYHGGGAFGGTLYNCTFSSNAAINGGGTSGATLHNCTLSGNWADYGAGAYAYSSTLYTCTLSGNTATQVGGGVRGGTLYNCTVIGNTALNGGGALEATLYNCTLSGNSASGWGGGGGARGGSLYNCILYGNTATYVGGGVRGSTLYDCTLTGNMAAYVGGAAEAFLCNCTLTGNSATNDFGGVSYAALTNCIVYFNTAPNCSNHADATFYYSCTLPLPPGEGNTDADPTFVNPATGDFRLRCGSPCIDTGTNLSALITNDLAGNPRPLDGNGDGVPAFDMGAYEFDQAELPTSDWYAAYDLDPANPQAIYEDPDHDGHMTFYEWEADTDPTNALSCLRITAITAVSNRPPVTVHFPSSSNRTYTLLWGSNVAGGVNTPALGQTNIAGTGGPQRLQDTSAVPNRFYRLQVHRR